MGKGKGNRTNHHNITKMEQPTKSVLIRMPESLHFVLVAYQVNIGQVCRDALYDKMEEESKKGEEKYK